VVTMTTIPRRRAGGKNRTFFEPLFFQVSTWFANARRRLKKENKMTWEPKNKLDDEDVDVSDDDDKDKDDDRHGERFFALL
jgi:hypothetical protein